MKEKAYAEIGIFGGSGFYQFATGTEEVEVETPYGLPSARIALSEINGRRVCFLPRHGMKHEFPPHKINYRANIWALKSLGVKRIISPCAAGSLQPHVKPGDIVICDQLVDRTSGRISTFYDGPETTHISFADPYCPELRQVAINKAKELGIPVHERGTVVVIEGPRFSTRAESKWFSGHGWEVINMTQYPEAVLAREFEICFVNISLITDWDVGLEGHPEVKAVAHEEVIRVFNENNEKLKKLLYEMIPAIPQIATCPCQRALQGARF